MPRYPDLVQGTPGLVHYFRMSGGATDADLGPGGATLTHNGSPTNVAALIKDSGNGAKRYAGTTQDSSFTTSAFSGATAMTMECWFRELSSVDWAHIMGNDDWPNARFGMLRNSNSGNLIANWRDSAGGLDQQAVGPYKQLDLNYAVASVDGTTIRLCINCVQVATAAMSGAFGTGSRTFRVNLAGGQALSGDVDEVALYLGTPLDIPTQRKRYKAGLAAGILNGYLLPQ